MAITQYHQAYLFQTGFMYVSGVLSMTYITLYTGDFYKDLDIYLVLSILQFVYCLNYFAFDAYIYVNQT